MQLSKLALISLLAVAPALVSAQEMKPAKPDPYVKKEDRPAKVQKPKAKVGEATNQEVDQQAKPVTPKDQRPAKQPRPKAEVGKEPGGEAQPAPTAPKAKQ